MAERVDLVHLLIWSSLSAATVSLNASSSSSSRRELRIVRTRLGWSRAMARPTASLCRPWSSRLDSSCSLHDKGREEGCEVVRTQEWTRGAAVLVPTAHLTTSSSRLTLFSSWTCSVTSCTMGMAALLHRTQSLAPWVMGWQLYFTGRRA